MTDATEVSVLLQAIEAALAVASHAARHANAQRQRVEAAVTWLAGRRAAVADDADWIPPRVPRRLLALRAELADTPNVNAMQASLRAGTARLQHAMGVVGVASWRGGRERDARPPTAADVLTARAHATALTAQLRRLADGLRAEFPATSAQSNVSAVLAAVRDAAAAGQPPHAQLCLLLPQWYRMQWFTSQWAKATRQLDHLLRCVPLMPLLRQPVADRDALAARLARARAFVTPRGRGSAPPLPLPPPQPTVADALRSRLQLQAQLQAVLLPALARLQRQVLARVEACDPPPFARDIIALSKPFLQLLRAAHQLLCDPSSQGLTVTPARPATTKLGWAGTAAASRPSDG